MLPLHRKIYDSIEEMIVNKFENGSLQTFFRKAALIRLRQAATNPGLLLKPLEDNGYDYDEMIDFQDIKTEVREDVVIDDNLINAIENYKRSETPSKFIKAKDLAENIINGKGKLLIWCEFVGNILELSDYLSGEGIMNKVLYGDVIPEEREKTIEEFHRE